MSLQISGVNAFFLMKNKKRGGVAEWRQRVGEPYRESRHDAISRCYNASASSRRARFVVLQSFFIVETMFKLCRKACRTIVMVLIVSMLGLFIVSASSSSHIIVPHVHHDDVGAHLADEDDNDHHQSGAGKKHTHKHNAGDHTHDIPLRPVGLRHAIASFPEVRTWHLAGFRSITILPPERPPKRAVVI
jgi:hypothetical protein